MSENPPGETPEQSVWRLRAWLCRAQMEHYGHIDLAAKQGEECPAAFFAVGPAQPKTETFYFCSEIQHISTGSQLQPGLQDAQALDQHFWNLCSQNPAGFKDEGYYRLGLFICQQSMMLKNRYNTAWQRQMVRHEHDGTCPWLWSEISPVGEITISDLRWFRETFEPCFD